MPQEGFRYDGPGDIAYIQSKETDDFLAYNLSIEIPTIVEIPACSEG